MLINQVIFPATTPERFDGNQVELTGLVTKIWARSTGDVFARISIGEASPDEGISEPGMFDARLTLQLPNGQVNGQDISLLKGDLLHITGDLRDITQWETLRDFLLKARQVSLLERIPELSQALDAQVKRMVTCVIPETLEVLNVKASPITLQSTARLEGIVARIWEYSGHLFVRLAVYDRHSFTNEQVDGRGVNLKTKDRIRIFGTLGSRVYSENLRSFLLSAHKADVLAILSDGQTPDEVWIAYVQTCLVAHKMIQFTKR
jgi:hypothetical protein